MAKKKSESVEFLMGDVMDSVPVLRMLAQSRMPATVGFKINLILKTLEPEIDAYEETRKGLLEQYAKHTKDGEIVTTAQGFAELEDQESFTNELNDVRDTLVSFDIHKIPLDDLEKIKIPTQHGSFEQWEPTPQELGSILYIVDA